jgi:HSP20 family protein
MAVLEKKEFDQQFEALFGRMFSEFPSFDFHAPRFTPMRPALDLYEENGKYVLQLVVPGYEPKDIKVEVTGFTVTIQGFHAYAGESRPHRYYYREIPRGSFTRTVTLPQDLDPERVDAKVEKGILTIALWPMKPIALKKVEVKAG